MARTAKELKKLSKQGYFIDNEQDEYDDYGYQDEGVKLDDFIERNNNAPIDSTTTGSASSDVSNPDTFLKFTEALDKASQARNNPFTNFGIIGESIAKGISLLDPNGDKALLTEEQKVNYANNNIANLSDENKNKLNEYNDILDELDASRMSLTDNFNPEENERFAANSQRLKDLKASLQQDLNLDDETFNKYVSSSKFLKNLEDRQRQQEEYANASAGEKILTNVGDALLSPIRPYVTLKGYLDEKSSPYYDENLGVDHNATGFDMANMNRDITTQATKDIEELTGANEEDASLGNKAANEVLKTLYTGVKSGADSMARLATGEVSTLLGAGLEAADQQYVDAQERGLTKAQAIGTAVSSGAAEVVFEKIPLDNMLKLWKNGAEGVAKGGVKSAVKDILKQAGLEGMEEVETDIANKFSDAIINKDKSEFNTQVEDYKAQGMDEAEAFGRTLLDNVADTVESFAGGAIGGLVGGGGAIAGSVATTKEAKKLDGNYREVAQAIPDNVEDYNSEEDYNKAMEVKARAEELDTQDKVSSADRTGLLQDIYAVNETMPNTDLIENINESVNSPFADVGGFHVAKNDITSQEVAQSMSQANNVNDFVEAYRDSQASSNVEARQTGQEYFETLAPKFDTYDEGSRPLDLALTQRSAEDLYTAALNGEEVNQDELNTTKKQQLFQRGMLENTVKQEVEAQRQARREEQKTFEPAQLHNIETPQGKADIADITLDNEGNFKWTKGDEEVVVPRKDISDNAMQRFMVNALNQPTLSAKQLYIDNYDGSLPIGSYNNAYESAFNAGQLNSKNFKGWLGSHKFYARSIPESTLEAFFNEGAKQVENKSKKVTSAKTKGTGKVTAEKGVENTPIHKLAQAFASKTGIDVEIRDGSILVTDGAQNALTDAEGNEIYSNGQFQADISKVIVGANGKELQTFMHEAIGEVLEAYNPEDMADIQDAILNYLLESKGDNYVDNVIKRYQRLYQAAEGAKSYRDAANEMVNDTLVGLFTTDKGANDFVNWCTKNDKSVLEKITDFIQAIIDKLKSLISDANLSSEARTVAEMSEKQAQKIRDRLFKAMDKAIDNYKGAEEGKASANTRHSLDVDTLSSNKTAELKKRTFEDGSEDYSINLKGTPKLSNNQWNEVFLLNDNKAPLYVKYNLNGEGLKEAVENKDVRYFTSDNKNDLLKIADILGLKYDTYDSEGNVLSENQQEYFKDSKVVDKEGNLLVMYHGTKADFNVFKTSEFGVDSSTMRGLGIYTISSKAVANMYGDNIKQVYVNITNPAYTTKKTLTKTKLKKFIKDLCEVEAKQLFEEGNYYNTVRDALKDTWVSNYTSTYDKSMRQVYDEVAKEILSLEDNDADIIQEIMGVTGNAYYSVSDNFYSLTKDSIGIDGYIDPTWSNPENNESSVLAIPFFSNQIKNTTNENPTESEDIRYSLTTDNVREYTLEPNSIHSQYEVADIWDNEELMDASDAEEDAKKKQIADLINDKDVLSFEVTQQGKKSTIFVSENTKQGEGKYRATWFDDKGAIMHVARDSAEELAKEILNDLSITEPINIKAYREGDNDFRYSLDVPTTYALDDYDPFIDDDVTETKDSKEAFTNSIIKAANDVLNFNISDKQVSDIADKMIADYSSTVDKDFVTKNLRNIFSAMNSDNIQDMTNALINLSEEVVRQSEEIDPDEQANYDDFIKNMPKIKLSEDQKNEAINRMGDWNTVFGAMGRFLSNDTTTTLDGNVYWQICDNALEHNYVMDRDANDADQLMNIIEAVENMRPQSRAIFEGGDITDAALVTANEIMQQYYGYALKDAQANANLKEVKADLKKQVDDYKKVIGKQYQERVNELNKQLKTKDNEIKQLRAFNTSEISKAISIEKARLATAEKNARADKTNLNKYIERQERNKYLKSIRNQAIRTIKMLENPTRNKFIPEVLQKPTIEMLQTFDFVTYRVRKNGELVPWGEEKGGEPTKTNRMWREKMEKLQGVLVKLERITDDKEDLSKYGANSSYLYNLGAQLGDVTEGLLDQFLQDTENDTVKISTLSSDKLKVLDKFMKSYLASINNAQEAMIDGNNVQLAKVGENVVSELQELKPITALDGTMKKKIKDILNLDMLEPITLLSEMGGTMEKLYWHLEKGKDVRDGHIFATEEAFSKAKKELNIGKNEPSKWETGLMSFKDGKLQLTPAQVMSLYAAYGRSQARHHIIFGGVKASDKGLRGKDKRLKKIQTKPVHLTPKDVEEIVNTLTPQQKALADFMVDYMSNEVSKWGNRVSQKRWGIRVFTESHYFPIKTYDATRNTIKVEGGNSNSLFALQNQGFTKPLVKDANNALVLENIFSVFADHVAKMAAYDGYVIPINDFMKVFNYAESQETFVVKQGEEGMHRDDTSVKEQIERVFGSGGTQYITKFIKNVNEDFGEGGSFNFLMDKYKAQAVLANMNVVVQQPTAYPRAAEVIDKKYLTKAISAAGIHVKRKIRRCQSHNTLAKYKSKGYYETSIGPSMQQMITGNATTKEKINELAGALAGLADDWTWSNIYYAAELKVQAEQKNLEKDSKEYFDAVNKVANEAFVKTQVVDSVFTKSQIMRSKDTGAKVLTAFMAEPTKYYNMLHRGWFKTKQTGKKKYIAKAVEIYIVGQVLNAVVVSFMGAWRDDDEEKSRWDKFLNSLLAIDDIKNAKGVVATTKAILNANLVSGLLPFNMIPFVKEGINALSGYESKNMTTQAIYDIIGDAQKLVNAAEGKGNLQPYGYLYYAAHAFSLATGIPMASAIREVKDLYNNVNDLWDGDNWVKTETQTDRNKKYFAKSDSITEGAKKVYDDKLEENLEKGKTQEEADKQAKSDAKGAITTYYKEKLIDLKENDMSEAVSLRAELVRAYTSLGDTSKQANDKIEKWFK